MSVKTNPYPVDAMVRAAASRGVRRATEVVRREVVRKIVEEPKTGRIYGNHQASAPGEAPASDSGRLLQSVNTDFDESTITGVVSASAAHAAHLEFGTEKMAARPFMRVSLFDKSKEVVSTIQAELKKVKPK